jgi:hypothetical protein
MQRSYEQQLQHRRRPNRPVDTKQHPASLCVNFNRDCTDTVLLLLLPCAFVVQNYSNKEDETGRVAPGSRSRSRSAAGLLVCA